MNRTKIITATIILLLAVGLYINQQQNSCGQDIKDFLSWYKDSYTSINALQNSFVNNYDGFYQINADSVDEFVSKLESSGYVSDEFIQKANVYFDNIEATLLEQKQSDGVVRGLDHDLILLTQESKYILSLIPDDLEIKTGRSKVSIENANLTFSVNRSCKIKNIGTLSQYHY